MAAMTMMDFINKRMEREAKKGETITLEEWTAIRQTNDWDAIADAWQRVEAAGGYDNLE